MTAAPPTSGGSHPAPAARRESAGRQSAKTQAVRGRGSIQSLERAAAILDVVARSPEGINLADLSSQVGLHNSTTFHLVKTLASLDFITQAAETKRYRIGSRLFMLAAGALDENALLSLATPIMERLSAQTGETTHLAIRSKQEIVVIGRTAASGLLQLAGRAGSVRPAHATALGKVLLAAMAPDDLGQLLKVLPLKRFTPKTVTDRRALVRQIDDVRRQGIAYDDGEFDTEVRCVAVPVRDFAGRCAGAIGLSGPVWRLSLQSLQEKSRLLRTAGAELSAQLGFNGGHTDG